MRRCIVDVATRRLNMTMGLQSKHFHFLAYHTVVRYLAGDIRYGPGVYICILRQTSKILTRHPVDTNTKAEPSVPDARPLLDLALL